MDAIRWIEPLARDAIDGVDAIAAVARQLHDVVPMDVQMPRLDGLDASRVIATRWSADERPRIAAMTADAMHGGRALCMAAAMDDYVTEPIRIERRVEALLGVPPRKDIRIG